MGKLGKRARKFSQKNLQSVYRKKRKFNSMRENSKRRRSSGCHGVTSGGDGKVAIDQPREVIDGTNVSGAVASNFLDALFSEDEDILLEDFSDSDGFLSEDSDCPYISETDHTHESEDVGGQPPVVGKNREMLLKLAKKKEKIDRLREKDPEFSKFLNSRKRDLKQVRFEDASSDEEEVNGKDGATEVEGINPFQGKVLTTHTIDVWCWMVLEEPNMLALPNLLNAFRASCHYGTGDSNDSSWTGISSKEVYSRIITFVLCEADGIFRRLLCMSRGKMSISKLNSSPKWLTVRPLIKSYLRSSLVLVKQLTDSKILAFTLSKLRSSIMFFSAFPSLFSRLIKTAVHFWATGDKHLSSSSFFILEDIATTSSSEWLEACLTQTYRAFISRCKFVEPASFKQIEFLSDNMVELYSVDIQCAYQKVLSALQELANVLQSGLKTKNKEELQRIHSWQYVNCLDVWVKFITKNIRDHDLQPVLYSVIQIVTGVAHLFPGRRYLPLRIKCVQMLNQLSSASGVFIPIVSLVLDFLECSGSSNVEPGLGRTCSFSSVLKHCSTVHYSIYLYFYDWWRWWKRMRDALPQPNKPHAQRQTWLMTGLRIRNGGGKPGVPRVPKQLLKSWGFQEECILSAIEQLSAHFAQWSYCISFPELVTIPLIVLKRFLEETTVESHRRLVEQNRDFVERKRDEVSFSPNDQASVESFLQVNFTLFSPLSPLLSPRLGLPVLFKVGSIMREPD
ncbi:unnamed protein product [Spirodela intermedia]|uniref:Uncharacterized protein n=1 Tax=Spirodela intermedia TaxID=51605 RepID=A0A7I8L7Z7_SPIIN|nr:unnamed protein product [Spirodela intermedia]